MLGLTTLFVKHLPPEFSREEREELLKLVGASKVRVMPDEGKMKYTAFATFPDHEDAKFALSLLHQKKILSKHLVVEFAKENHAAHVPHQSDYPEFKEVSSKDPVPKLAEREILRQEVEDFSRKLHGVAPTLGLDYLPNPLLKYKYPPPTPTIIQNISHALASVPKFYSQVLHLMNKMNLPAPFGPLTPAPPLAHDIIENPEMPQKRLLEEVESSEEESEYESESEDGKPKPSEKVLPQARVAQKPARKKMKLTAIVPPPSAPKQRTEPSDVFESTTLCQKKITLKTIEQIKPVEPAESFETTGGFGAFETSKETTSIEDDKEEEVLNEWDDSKFISLKEIKDNRISTSEMMKLSIYKNTQSCEPTCRLYIKNLAKQVEEKNLRYLFGRFINKNSELERNMFDIRLMKEGRMKGQAFVTLASEKQALEAVREMNGYILYSKPLVVQFARSAKPKEDDKKGKKT